MSSPRIKATFKLDKQGKPVLIERDNLKHYYIKLHIEGAPEDTYAVTYVLDESYHEPVRESLNVSQGFSEILTSYGDFPIQAKIRTKSGVLMVASELSAALNAGHEYPRTQDIETALKDIQEN